MSHSNRLGASTGAKGQDVAEADSQPGSTLVHSRGMPLGRRKIPERYCPDIIFSLSPKSHSDCFEGLIMGRTSKFAVVRTVIDRFDCDEDPQTVLVSTWSVFLLGISALLNRHVIDVGEQENPPATSCQGRDLHQERNTPTRASATPAAAKAACAPGNVVAQPRSESFRSTESLMGELQRGQGNDLIARLLVEMSKGRDVFDQEVCPLPSPQLVDSSRNIIQSDCRPPDFWLEGRNQRAPARNRIVVFKGSHVTTNSDRVSARRDDPTTEELDEILVQNISILLALRKPWTATFSEAFKKAKDDLTCRILNKFLDDILNADKKDRECQTRALRVPGDTLTNAPVRSLHRVRRLSRVRRSVPAGQNFSWIEYIPRLNTGKGSAEIFVG
ncbi:hypothetical protein IWZ03DRAFT_403564 [Phyllosticta citriasiana]|uniref:Uncharacterized protein n=1 Tax=Phyllosticta citriasiana TaxID=595635 RepID=A0ABR1L0L7_9PEZI